jgi:hypothetical protein
LVRCDGRLENIDMTTQTLRQCSAIIDEMCGLDWCGLTEDELTDVAWAYYWFSIQFRESLDIACTLYPDDANLKQLRQEECETDNLSPHPGVAKIGERMNHDEFMRRLLQLSPIAESRQSELGDIGRFYLAETRGMEPSVRALGIAGYEDGGLERIFRAILQASCWRTPLLLGFRWFLTRHIRFDSDTEQGHGALSRHLMPDDRILPLWTAFRGLLIRAVPRLAKRSTDEDDVSWLECSAFRKARG